MIVPRAKPCSSGCRLPHSGARPVRGHGAPAGPEPRPPWSHRLDGACEAPSQLARDVDVHCLCPDYWPMVFAGSTKSRGPRNAGSSWSGGLGQQEEATMEELTPAPVVEAILGYQQTAAM